MGKRNSKMAKPREVTPIIRAFQNWMSQRVVVNHARFETNYTPREGNPDAKMPKGSSHLMSDNAYWARDGRRMSQPASVVYNQGPKQLEAGQEKESKVKAPLPGKVFGFSTTGQSC